MFYEGLSSFQIDGEEEVNLKGPASKTGNPFYNRAMATNRDITMCIAAVHFEEALVRKKNYELFHHDLPTNSNNHVNNANNNTPHRNIPTYIIFDAMGGSGVRSLRFLCELPFLISHCTSHYTPALVTSSGHPVSIQTSSASEGSTLRTTDKPAEIVIHYNDISSTAVAGLKHNLMLCLKTGKATLKPCSEAMEKDLREQSEGKENTIRFNPFFSKDSDIAAGLTFRITSGDLRAYCLNNTFDFIDIDPFGSPVPFAEHAICAARKEGIIAVTATDTSSLAGAYPAVCMRRYWSIPTSGYNKHEMALRILIWRMVLAAASYDIGLFPVFSLSSDHFVRVFLKVKKSVKDAEAAL
ncbi:MAG: hypothetical protein QW728_07525, partial [Thermoplasmata archaeon]